MRECVRKRERGREGWRERETLVRVADRDKESESEGWSERGKERGRKGERGKKTDELPRE